MPGRLNTIIIVPHGKTKLIKLSFSTRFLIVAACAATIALVLALVAIGYTGSAVTRRAEVRRLSRQNRELAEVNRQLAHTVAEVQGRLDQFEERTGRLALAAGVKSALPTEGRRSPGADQVGGGGAYDRLPGTPERLQIQGQWIERQLDTIEKQLNAKDQMLAGTPTIAPVLGLITAGYGQRRDPFTGRQAYHSGIDISARRGLPVQATADGVVVFAGHDTGLGQVVRISHGFGYTTVFGHLDQIGVKPGDEVQRGQTVGLLGNTGRSTGPHLHYEVYVDGQAANPLYYILDAY